MGSAGPRILVIDIETAPHIAHVWTLWKQNVALNQLTAPGYVLCFAAKWLGSRDIVFARVEHDPATGEPTAKSRRDMLELAHGLLSQADVVVHYYGSVFDVPRLNAEFMEFGFAPPPPYKQVDLKVAIQKRAVFASHKLAHISDRLGVGSKVKHEGHSLWRACMADDPQAWERMRRYNVGDVRLTERLYKRVLPWLPGHPNHALYVDSEDPRCPTCGSTHLQRRGVARTNVSVFPRYQCVACRAWSRGRASERRVARSGVTEG